MNAQPSDSIFEWFDHSISKRLENHNIFTLDDLRSKIKTNNSWFSNIPGIGSSKAVRVAAHLTTLLSEEIFPKKEIFSSTPFASAISKQVDDKSSFVIHQATSLVHDLSNDREAVKAWAIEKAISDATKKSYRKESERLLLWLEHERGSKTFAMLSEEDCESYVKFLKNIPAHWISRVRAMPYSPGWAPFRCQLNSTSIHQALSTVHALFDWMRSIKYIPRNPWPTSIREPSTYTDASKHILETKPLPSLVEVIVFLDKQPPCPSSMRMKFVLQFMLLLGLKPTEVLNSKFGDIYFGEDQFKIHIRGEGVKNRIIAMGEEAKNAFLDYYKFLNIEITNAQPDAPLVGSTKDPYQHIGYQSFYESLKSWKLKCSKSSIDLTIKSQAPQIYYSSEKPHIFSR